MRIVLITLAVLLSGTAFAAQISQVKGAKALIKLDGIEASVGSEFYAINSEGKRKAILVIKQVKGNSAIADITKGAAAAGFTLQSRSGAGQNTASASASAPAASTQSRKGSGKKMGLAGGVLAGLNQNVMVLAVQPSTGGTKQDMQLVDTSYSLKGFVDYPMSPSINLRGAVGMETFNVKGQATTNICGTSTTPSCAANFTYLAFEGAGQYNLMTGNMRWFVGAGYSFLMEMGKSNNIYNLASDGKTNQVILLSTGIDWALSAGSFVPVVLEYGLFPGTSNVQASAIYVRAGYGRSF
jgi:hypothetical protein